MEHYIDLINYFNKKLPFKNGDKVLIILEKSPYFKQIGTIVQLPIHPCTWIKVQFTDNNILSFRNSSLILHELNYLNDDKLDQIFNKNNIEINTNKTNEISNQNDVIPNNINPNDAKSNEIKPKVFKSNIKTKLKKKNIIKVKNNMGCINKYGYCYNCNVKGYLSDKFCWNTNCNLSPIYYKFFIKEITN